MFGRDLIEQVKADSRGGTDRLVPILVEKCIDAVDALGKHPRSANINQFISADPTL